MKHTLNITIMGKPRMTRADVWKDREVVQRYWTMKDQLTIEARKAQLTLPDEFGVTFYLPMPSTWSKKKQERMEGEVHQRKPDVDNLLKSLLDCLKPNDQSVHTLTHLKKRYSVNPRVEVEA